jgi:hypothetical protein
MKTKLLTFLLFCSISFLTKANISSDFDLDVNKINLVFEATANLENYLINNENADFLEVSNMGFSTINKNHASLMLEPLTLVGDNPVMGIPSYVWGGCLSIVGVGIVYLTLEKEGDSTRKEETKKALIGCVAGGCLIGGAYALLGRGYYY